MAVWVEIKCYSVVYFDCVTVFQSKTALYLRTRISGLALITWHPLGVRVTCSKLKVHCAAPYRDVYTVVQKTKSGLHKHIRLCTGGDYRKWHNFRPMENSSSKESRQIRSARALSPKLSLCVQQESDHWEHSPEEWRSHIIPRGRFGQWKQFYTAAWGWKGRR